ncbi:MAG: glycosyltransferase [Verrucomicrobia bacterium]|nr:glycosyltransferase [Verrucomicrobiota bacterium]
MKVAHVIPYLGRAQGGPVFALAAYAAGLAEAGCHVEVFSVIHPDDGLPIVFAPRVQTSTFGRSRWGTFRRSPRLARALAQAPCEIIHSHGLWTDVHRSAYLASRCRGLPHLVATCGMLAPTALSYHWWKKLPVRIWFQAQALHEAQCLHAKSELEHQHLRQFGLRNPVAIIPNPVAPSAVSAVLSSAEFQKGAGVPAGKDILLYLGRMHPVKGLPRLIEAWAALREHHDRWLLVLAGPDERGYKSKLEALVRQVRCVDSVLFTGELNQAKKWAALASAKLFVMPSDFENFGNSIAEALLSGLPVITTTGTPWQELPGRGAGWYIPPTATALTASLREAMALPEQKRQEMSVKATTFASQFSLETTIANLIQVYEWLLGQENRPKCVHLKS